MDFLPENLLNLFNRYTEMQEQHLEELTKPETDMESMNFERSRNFAALEQELRHLLRQMQNAAFSDEVKEEMATACKQRIGSLLETDTLITEKIQKRKEDVSRQLREMKKGQHAMAGYGSGFKAKTLVRLSG
ncbi:hypothetical protein OOT00_00095 [Desulfobotulus sp. H1]|uniref:Flagellar protein FliT n=1 Tax=Desulfobotulus pelophilus TaxID=2823377 RepID=A0ABT3N4K3_9BACT|nr:hypothetical protein [Desulfobotulus pelophilus]MCW7752385.1 hypothetical protein [Desulfobotulus pelophilus]